MSPSHGHDKTIVNGISRIGYMKGGKAALWVDEDMADTSPEGPSASSSRTGRGRFSCTSRPTTSYVPRVPHPRFAGKTRWARGATRSWSSTGVSAGLARSTAEADRNTLVIFTSDNGPVLDDGYQDDAVEKLGGHSRPARCAAASTAISRGERACRSWRAGRGGSSRGVRRAHRPGRSPRDLRGTRAPPLQAGAAPDSLERAPPALGDSPRGRDHVVLQANGLALRRGQWKYIEPGRGAKVNAEHEHGARERPAAAAL